LVLHLAQGGQQYLPAASTFLPPVPLPAASTLPPGLFLVHLAWILCQNLIRQLYPVTCEPIQRDTVLLFYHFNTLSHSADSGALISPLTAWPAV
jgi:hypothetical protein